MHPDDERLADLALGWDDDLDDEARRHVADCDRCREVVAELERTTRLLGALPEVVPGIRTGPPVWEQPPSSVRDAVLEATTSSATARIDDPVGARTATGTPGPGPIPLPAVTARRGLQRSSVGWLLAAAAGLVVGLFAGRPIWSAEPAPTPTTLASVALDTLDTKAQLGEASLVRLGGVVDLTVQTQPLDPGSGYLEVWLINSDGKRMVSVGVLDPSGRATFPISADLLTRGYVIVDISREGYDARPEHSGDSLARGTLPA